MPETTSRPATGTGPATGAAAETATGPATEAAAEAAAAAAAAAAEAAIGSLTGWRVEPSVAAVVVTFNRAELLRCALTALAAQSRPVDEIVVVDNASSDGTAQMLAADFPAVRHLRLTENTGPAGGFAAGLREAAARGHDWIWVFNDDDEPLPDALATLADEIARIPAAPDPVRLGMLASWLESETGEPLPLGLAWRHRHRPLAKPDLGAPAHQADVLIFAGVLISARLVADIGLPREDYFIMCEELEYCLRARRAGWEIRILPTPLTRTLHAGAAPGADPPWREYYQTRNQLLMSLERRSAAEVYWWFVRQLKFAVATVLWKDRKAARLRLRMLGAWHGLRGVRGRTIDPAAAPR